MNPESMEKLFIGVKQVKRVLRAESAEQVLIASDAENQLVAEIVQLAVAKSVPIHYVPTMKELGKYCQIDVGAAAAVIIK